MFSFTDILGDPFEDTPHSLNIQQVLKSINEGFHVMKTGKWYVRVYKLQKARLSSDINTSTFDALMF